MDSATPFSTDPIGNPSGRVMAKPPRWNRNFSRDEVHDQLPALGSAEQDFYSMLSKLSTRPERRSAIAQGHF